MPTRMTRSEPEKPLPPEGLLFFDHLYGEFLALRAANQDSPLTPLASSTIEEIVERKEGGSSTWNDLYTFDLILTRLQPVEKLNRKVWNLRARYRDVAGLREYDAYLASKPPDWAQAAATKENELELRADVEYLLGEIYLRYAITPVREKMRSRISRMVAGATLLWLGVTLLITFLIHSPKFMRNLPLASPLVVVIFVGALGGLVSMQQRYQSLSEEGDAVQNVSELIKGWHNVYLPAISGSIFAVILYLLVLAGMLSGGLFPAMVPDPAYSTELAPAIAQVPATQSTQPTRSIQEAVLAPEKQRSQPSNKPNGVAFVEFLRQANPRSRTDYAKLLVWSFIAGFAERFVPDTLSRFTARKEADAGMKT
jgi:hypothetical protein